MNDLFPKDKQIISIDWSNGKDYSAISCVCGNCGYILETLSFQECEKSVNFIIYKKCPKCGVKFKKHIVIE